MRSEKYLNGPYQLACLTLRVNFTASTQERLAEVEQTGMQPILPIRSGSGHPLFCFYPGSGSAWQYTVLNRYLHSDLPIIGLQSPRPDGLLANSTDMDELMKNNLRLFAVNNQQDLIRY